MKNSIINLDVVDTTKEPLFFGKPLNIQRYDRHKYQKIFELFRQHMTFFWTPEEVSISKDRADYQDFTDQEKFIFTKNLGYQILLDSVQSRGIGNLVEKCSNPELEAFASIWQFSETLHSYSYTYVIKNLYPNPSEIFDEVLKDQEILKRATSVTKYYDDMINGLNDDNIHEAKKKLYLTLMSVNILEGIRFYVSFACSYCFAQNKTMEGNAKIISLINRDENCVTPDTEVLTPNGWVRFDNLGTTQDVAQYNKDHSISFVRPSKIINKEYDGDMYHIKNIFGGVDQMVTPDHRVIYRHSVTGEIKEQTAKDFNCNYIKEIIKAAPISNEYGEESLTDHQKLLIAIQADGTILDKNFRNGGCHVVTFRFSGERKKGQLESLLNNLGYEWSKSRVLEQKNTHQYHVKIPNDRPLTNSFSEWVDSYDNISKSWCSEFIEEVVKWDGHIRDYSENSLYYSSVDEENVDVVQTLSCLCGYKTHKYKEVDDREYSYNDIHRLSIITDKDSQSGQSLNKTLVENYKGRVYCVSVPSGMFLARRNGNIFVTGNCHLGFTQNILKYLRKNPEEGFQDVVKECEPIVQQMFKDAADEEIQWAKYLFENGTLIGLNDEILIQYMKHLTNRRTTAIGVTNVFEDTKNPINWIKNWTESGNIQPAPQEVEKDSYLIGSFNQDVTKETFNDFEL